MREIPQSWVRKFSTVKTVPSTLSYVPNAIIRWVSKWKSILRTKLPGKQNKVGKLVPHDQQCRERGTAPGTDKPNTETESRAQKVILSYLENRYDRAPITDRQKGCAISKRCWGHRLSIQTEHESLLHTVFLKIHFKDLKVNCKTLKFVEENTREYFQNFWIVKKNFLKQDTRHY